MVYRHSWQAVFLLSIIAMFMNASCIIADETGHHKQKWNNLIEKEQSRNFGLQQPQPIASLPKQLVKVEMPIRKPKHTAETALMPLGDHELVISNGWELIEADKLSLSGQQMTERDIDTKAWYNATVPGTVLTTLVDSGIYPDPHGASNLFIQTIASI